MATLKQQVVSIARNYLRDFPKFYQTSFSPAGRTYEIVPNIDAPSLWVAYVPNSASAGSPAASAGVITLGSTEYDVDSRNGMLRFKAPLPNAYRILVEGYSYGWINPDDMSFYADQAINQDTHSIPADPGDLAPAVIDVIGIHTLVEALWGLTAEFSRDIDVITSESVHIQASQRYRMVSDLRDHWEAEYKKRAASLNIGLDRIEQYTMRRVSRATNRLVPIYRSREYGEIGPIERIWPEIPTGYLQIENPPDRLRQDVYVEGDPPPAYGYSGGFGPW